MWMKNLDTGGYGQIKQVIKQSMCNEFNTCLSPHAGPHFLKHILVRPAVKKNLLNALCHRFLVPSTAPSLCSFHNEILPIQK